MFKTILLCATQALAVKLTQDTPVDDAPIALNNPDQLILNTGDEESSDDCEDCECICPPGPEGPQGPAGI